MKILIIPEDRTLDQHVIRPVVQRIFKDLGRTPRVDVLSDPALRGVAQALDPQFITEIVADNPMIDLFLLMIDRDCNHSRSEEKAKKRVQEHSGRLLACLARQEIEVWALALHRKELQPPWQDVFEECHPKERFWDPFVASKGWHGEVGHGRKRAMRELGSGWRGILQVCPELAALKAEINEWLASRP